MLKLKSTFLIFLVLMTIATSLLFFKSSNVTASTDMDPDPDVTPFENAFWDFDEGDIFAWDTKYSLNGDDDYLESPGLPPRQIYNVSEFSYELMKQHAPEIGFEIGAEFVWNVTIVEEFFMNGWFSQDKYWKDWLFGDSSGDGLSSYFGSDPCTPAPLINYSGKPDEINKTMKLVVQDIEHIDDEYWQIDVDTWNWTTGTFGVDPDISINQIGGV